MSRESHASTNLSWFVCNERLVRRGEEEVLDVLDVCDWRRMLPYTLDQPVIQKSCCQTNTTCFRNCFRNAHYSLSDVGTDGLRIMNALGWLIVFIWVGMDDANVTRIAALRELIKTLDLDTAPITKRICSGNILSSIIRPLALTSEHQDQECQWT